MDNFRGEIWPVLVAHRLLSRFPFQVSKDGIMEVKTLSVQMMYFVITYVAQTFLVLQNIQFILYLMLDTTDFPQIVLCGLNFCVMLIHFETPLSLFKQWRLMCDLFNSWTLFQVSSFHVLLAATIVVRYREVMKEDYITTLNLVVTISVCVIPVLTLSLVALHSTILISKDWYFLSTYAFIVTSIFYLYALWVVGLVEVIGISDKIRERSFKVVESKTLNNKTIELYNLRILWLDLSLIVRSASNAVACSMIFISSLIVVIFVASAYGFIQCIALGDERYVLFFNVMVAVGFLLSVPCEVGYRVSLHVGTYIVEMLSSINVKEQEDSTAREVDLFLQAVFANYPNVSYGGMVTINRQTITGLLSSTLTYLIVLLQLQIVQQPERPTSESELSATTEAFQVQEGQLR